MAGSAREPNIISYIKRVEFVDDNSTEMTNQAALLNDEEKPLSIQNRHEEHSLSLRIRRSLAIRNIYLRTAMSEFLGTLVLVTLGDGVVAQTILSQGEVMPRGNIVTIHVGWGWAVTLGIFAAGSCSGGHINPAFSLVCALLGKIPWKKLPFYWMGQFLGAFCGAAIVYATYYDAIKHFTAKCEPQHVYNITGNCATAGIFSTYPQDHVSNLQGFIDQVVGTALLAGLALAIIDQHNFALPHNMIPLMVGIMVSGIVAAFEYNCGAALNPARDLGPRVFTAIAGWGSDVFTYRNYWSLVPVFGPIIGALVGAAMYMAFVGLHWPET